jgi:hypothetical protein
MNSSNLPNSQESNQRGQAIADLISDMLALASTLDSFALSFTLAWRKQSDHQRQPSPIITATQERTTP